MKKSDLRDGLEVEVICYYEITMNGWKDSLFPGAKGVVVQWPPSKQIGSNEYHVSLKAGFALVKFKERLLQVPITHLDFANPLEKLARI